MARTKSSENENSDDEVILRVKKKIVMAAGTSSSDDLKNDDNSLSSPNLFKTPSLQPSSSLTSTTKSGDNRRNSDFNENFNKKIFFIKSFSCIESTSNLRENSDINSNLSEMKSSSTTMDLIGIKSLLESNQIEIWRQDKNSAILIPKNFNENDQINTENQKYNNLTVVNDLNKKVQQTKTIPKIVETPLTAMNSTINIENDGDNNKNLSKLEEENINNICTDKDNMKNSRPPLRRESFLRQSMNTIFRRNFYRSLSHKSTTSNVVTSQDNNCNDCDTSNYSNGTSVHINFRDNKENKFLRQLPISIENNRNFGENQDEESSDCLSKLNTNSNENNSNRFGRRFFRTNSTSSSCSSSERSTSSVSIGIRSSTGSPMAPLQNQSEIHGQSIIGLNNIGKSPNHQNIINNNNNINNNNSKLDTKSSKQSIPTTPVTAASTGRSISPHPNKSSSTSLALAPVKNEIPEKEKKRKELSSSRQTKFHRHFQQVPKDEKVLNYFSCALVSDILLQGHLYITDQHFAFYSNVFGFVTKLLIPTASVIKISKEKTAKIIPNAVGVATVDERHVFGSFMSREAAFRLMCSVCRPLEAIENIPPKVPDVEVSEECSVEDDSSCSISGNESPPHLAESSGGCTADGSSNTATSNCNNIDSSQVIRQRKLTVLEASQIQDVIDGKIEETAKLIGTSSILCSSSPNTPVKISKSPPPKIISSSSHAIRLKFPTDFHIVYLGLVLTIILALLSGFLFYRILDIEARTNYRASIDFNWDSNNEEDVYAKALKWQKEMQTKSTEEAQNILTTNLEQIAKVRRSLETLSLLIHDKNIHVDDDNNHYASDSLFHQQENST